MTNTNLTATDLNPCVFQPGMPIQSIKNSTIDIEVSAIDHMIWKSNPIDNRRKSSNFLDFSLGELSIVYRFLSIIYRFFIDFLSTYIYLYLFISIFVFKQKIERIDNNRVQNNLVSSSGLGPITVVIVIDCNHLQNLQNFLQS